jgi:hypothetical protein|tara:strand:+ start:144 stop:347 length:204 start_codon:yes stop_codon:yes gene_type:complete
MYLFRIAPKTFLQTGKSTFVLRGTGVKVDKYGKCLFFFKPTKINEIYINEITRNVGMVSIPIKSCFC